MSQKCSGGYRTRGRRIENEEAEEKTLNNNAYKADAIGGGGNFIYLIYLHRQGLVLCIQYSTYKGVWTPLVYL